MKISTGHPQRLRRFGLIGHPLEHSLSPLIHERIMDVVGVRGEYRLYEVEPERLQVEVPRLLRILDGFNCTIPHKQTVMGFLQGLAPSAKLCGAVNTVYEGIGHNTDGVGFTACGVPMQGRKVRILGAGGVARVLALEAARAGAAQIVVEARNSERAQALVHDLEQQGYQRVSTAENGEYICCDVLLNGTPVGMWPHFGGLPPIQQGIKEFRAVFDTVYNPTATRLVLKAKSEGIWAMGGLRMLFEQALATQKIWHRQLDFGPFQDELIQIMRELAREVLKKSPLKLVLTGFMGSGKTQIGRLLAQRLQGHLPFVDLDDVIVKEAGQSIAEIFASQGEEAFRSLERQCLLEQLQRSGSLILATGGGALAQKGMEEVVHSLEALVIYLDVRLETALERIGDDPTRPLLQGGRAKIESLYTMRRPLYEAAADLRLEAQGRPEEIVDTILEAFEWND